MKTIILVSRFLLITVGLLSASFSLSQAPEIEWSRTYGGDSTDVAYSVQQTSDGGYVFAGYTKSFNADGEDALLVKTDSLGYIEWYRLYGGGDNDRARAVEQTTDGGYILIGNSRSFGNSNGIYLIKTGIQGDTLWTRIHAGTNAVAARSGQQTSDGGYIIAGYTKPYVGALDEMYLLKTDNQGHTQWTRSYGGADERVAYSVKQTSDSGYIVAGWNPNYGGVEYDIYLVKTDSQGDTLWTHKFGGSGEESAFEVEQTSDGGYIVAGWTDSYGAGYGDFYAVKTDSLGDTLWTRTYGGPDGDGAYSVQQTADGGYILAGTTSSFGAGYSDLYLVKIDAQGDTIWTLVYGGANYDMVTSVDLTNDGGYIVAGYIWDWEMPADAWLVKIGPDTAVSGAPSIQWVSHPNNFILHAGYPNPFNPTTTISYEVPVRAIVRVDVYNVLGQKTAELLNAIKSAGHHSISWDGGDLPSGVYFVRLEAGEFVHTKKVVLLK